MRSDGSSPVGVAVLGQRGSGKTHLLGWVREQLHLADGYFFLIGLRDASTFWRSAALSMVEDLPRDAGEGSQLTGFLRRLAELVGAPPAVRQAAVGEAELSRASLDAFVDQLRKASPQVGMACQHTLRALVLLASDVFEQQDIGHAYLCGNDEGEHGERARWGIRRSRHTSQDVVRELSRLLALTGPTVIAVDQIDLLIAQSVKSAAGSETGLAGSPEDRLRQALVLEQVAGGLMALREATRRTLSIVSCLPQVWEMVRNYATDTVQDRFKPTATLWRIPTPELAEQLVARRFTERFAEVGFTPPYPTWPIAPVAFARARKFTPRQLLITVDTHVRACLRDGEVRELSDLRDTPQRPAGRPARRATEAELVSLDQEFAELRASVDPTLALALRSEDTRMPGLLHAGLTIWIAEADAAGAGFYVDPPPGRRPALHARLRRSLAEQREDEVHWCFRAVAPAHGNSELNRVRNAMTAAGLTEGVPKRRLFLLRNEDWNRGRRTAETLETFHKAGGEVLPLPDDDVRTLTALRELLEARGIDALRPWLAARRPAHGIALFQAAFLDVVEDLAPGLDDTTPEGSGTIGTEPLPPHKPDSEASTAPAVLVGRAREDGEPVGVDLAALRRHTVIFAGSGSGKTVLIRRLVEECARQGVSAIVLDPNNDLARLGDPWPEPPAGWWPGDEAAAADYLAHTEVVIWTPGTLAGRPLSFQPLPDFAEVRGDPDEFEQAVEAAVAALAPRARVEGKTPKASRGQAVLREALRHYGRQGSSELAGFIELLSELPEGVSQLDEATKLANELAQNLRAATVNDRLFASEVGAPVDPGVLLTPAPGRRSRISVVSFVGLASNESKQSFVNQLQLALFAWIKQHPAGDRPLGGLFVMDEAATLAPAQGMTPCTQSTIALTAQARKYGLGLVFATQAPKSLHNQISGNASTQFFGLLNVPAQIAAAKELARAKAGEVPDIGRLGKGEFYAAIEGAGFRKLQAPLCLSHHPASALTPEEVLAKITLDHE
ncbi:helicase HerA domain-containing protein [Natronosporangium hydrolyticum]|uniref:helicase HerA domain-containing protein n=1 Tax=Natronosporangium hydrolyticum TaxID=2811111 RepID=UPI0030841E33